MFAFYLWGDACDAETIWADLDTQNDSVLNESVDESFRDSHKDKLLPDVQLRKVSVNESFGEHEHTQQIRITEMNQNPIITIRKFRL